MNHLRFSHDPRCASFRDGFVYQYTATLVNPPTGSSSTPHSTTPDVQMLDIPNEELSSHSDIFPSPSHEAIYMSINENIDHDSYHDDNNNDNDDYNNDDYNNEDYGDSDKDANDTTNGESNDEDGGGGVDPSLETVFHCPSWSDIATDDLEIDPETSDDDEEPQWRPMSPPPVPEVPRHSGPLGTQTSG